MLATWRKARLTLFVPGLVLAALIAGCGGDDDSSSTTEGTGQTIPAATEDSALAGQVPEDVRQKGTLTVATDPTYAPMEFTDDAGTIVGADADLAKSIAEVLGLKVDMQSATFDAIIPAVESGRYNLGMSSFTDNKEREQQVDFVTYMTAGTGFFTLANGGTDVSGLADLCGKSVAVERGTTQQEDSEAQSKKCTDAGKEPVKVTPFPDQNGANLALSSNRVQLGMADSPVAEYQVKESDGKFKMTGEIYGAAPYGIAMGKKTELQQAVLGAVKKLMEGGQYEAILKKWGLEQGAIDDPKINGATS